MAEWVCVFWSIYKCFLPYLFIFNDKICFKCTLSFMSICNLARYLGTLEFSQLQIPLLRGVLLLQDV